MSPARFTGLLACASVAIGLSEDQRLTEANPLLWQLENSSQSLIKRTDVYTVQLENTFTYHVMCKMEANFLKKSGVIPPKFKLSL